MNARTSVLSILVACLSTFTQAAEKLQFSGVLGNSGDSGGTLATFSDKPATGIGPVIDLEHTIWERAGSTQLNRYALDGRLLRSFELPDFNNKFQDRMTLVDDFLLFHFRDAVYRLSVDAAPGSKPERLPGKVTLMSSTASQDRVAILSEGEILWLDPASNERTVFLKTNDRILRQLFVDSNNGTVYGFSNEQVFGWDIDGKLITGFPRSFRAECPQKIGEYWYSHGYHGTILRFNNQFEPDPGVVLGGASGSFIGYLPESADLTRGTGLVHVRDNLFAISGHEGVVQLLEWQEKESQFKIVRRIGALHGLKALALDASGNIWTPRGSWRWADSSATSLSLGDVQPQHTTQPVVLDGKHICFIKNHYNNYMKCHGTVFDANGWAHMEARGVKGFTLEGNTRASTAFINAKGQRKLLVSDPAGKAAVFGLSENGQISDNPESATLPGLQNCSSLGWFAEHLLAADKGAVKIFRETEQGWEAVTRLEEFGDGELHLHSDGKTFVVSDSGNGKVEVFDSLERGAVVASYDGLAGPKTVAVSGDRVVVYEEGKQRLVKFRFGSGGFQPPSRNLSPRRLEATATDKFSEFEYYELGHSGGVPIAVAIRDNQISFRVPDETTDITFGVSNGSEAITVNGTSIKLPAGDWSKIRLAAFVKTPDQQERVGFRDHQPIHAPFSENPDHWAPFDLAKYKQIATERKEQIRITFDQPIEGKASLVIERPSGERIRNLISGQSFSAGKHTVVWDGLDENGQLVAPADYQWRGIAHPGITPDFKISFAGGREPVNARPWGTNHGILHDAVANDEHIFFAAPVTEGGWALMALDADGNFVQGYEHQQGFGIGTNAIAIDDQYLYCAQDGFGWGGHKNIDWDSDSWKAPWNLTVARYDLKTGKVVEFPDGQRAFTADAIEVGPGTNHPDLKSYNLGGLAVSDGKIYVGCRKKNIVNVFESDTGEKIKSLSLRDPRILRFHEGELFAATDSGIVRVSDQKVLIKSDEGDFTGLTFSPQGDIWVSDAKSHQIRRYSITGKPIETIGTPGGPYKGAYDLNRLVQPTGITFGPKGKLWATEKRWNPKRILAWDLDKRAVVYEKFGIPHYGGDGSGFDPDNANRWIGLGCLWDVDIAAQYAKPTHIMAMDEAHFEHYHPQGYSFFREAGRTFLCTRGKIALLLELFDDGTTRPIAASCGTHHFAYGCNWDPPRAYIDAFYTKWPEKRIQEKPGRGATGKPWAGRVGGVLWVDRNADGETQQEEFSFTEENTKFADGAWGHRQDSLTFRFPAVVDGQSKIIEIKPNGFMPNGIPDYPSLSEAMATGSTDISLTPGHNRNGVSTACDRFGRFIFNSDPEMNAYSLDGKHLWTYPNQWSNVHGSHKAPLPENGVMQGTMAILGMAPFDEKADVFFLNGNHGRCFLLSSDGIYLDECFTDVRVSYLRNEYRLGGEIFGGMFDRSTKDGNYYVQIGHGPYRIYQLHGLDEAKRIKGEISVTKNQITAAERGRLRQLSEKQVAKKMSLPGEIKWDQSGKFKTSLSAVIKDQHLHLTYQVEDQSPWINNGRDWTTLFATGDSVDLQIGVNSAADPKRSNPVEGDQRLLIAPFEGNPIAVLYQHVKPGGKNPIEFTSPWRGAQVDHVEKLEGVIIEVKKSNHGYTVATQIPLAALGLKQEGTCRADFGVTFGDPEGTETQLRSYWANPATMLVDDIPGEIMLHPNLWGEIEISR